MSTCYRIELGYRSGYSSELDQSWERLKEIVNSLTPDELKAEYLAYETLTKCERGCCKLDDFIDSYSKRDDLTLIIDEKNQSIIQYASAAGDSRAIKEGLRRAFCRLIIQAAHREHIEVSMSVG